METAIANQLTPTKVSGRLATWHRVMTEAGLSFDALQWCIDDPEKRKRLVRFWMSGCYEATTSQKLAREIMGSNFLGIGEAVQCFGVNPSKKQLEVLAEIPLSEGELQNHKDTHVLTAVFPLSILDVREKVDRRLFYPHAWYNQESFAKKGKLGWQFIRKDILPNSTNKNWGEQQALLKENEETPLAQIMVYTIILKYLVTGERLFERVYVRCRDLDSYGDRVNMGYFGPNGLNVYRWTDDTRYGNLGLAVVQKFPKN